MDGMTDRCTNRWIKRYLNGRHMDVYIWLYWQMNILTDGKADKWMDRQMDAQTGRCTDRWIERRLDGQTDGCKDRQTD
jgi:hypothetical protein